MISQEFADKLTASFSALNDRITALEHSVNEVLIGGLKTAAEEYEDDLAFSDFSDRNKDILDKYGETGKIIYGEDFDVPSAVYEEVKAMDGYGSDDFDEAGSVQQVLSVIDEKIDALENLRQNVEEQAESEDVGDVDVDEAQLAKEFAEYKNQ